ncbi:MAG: deoxyribose-phosphate aldolase [Clostridia bacterium]|nr:deoxyribose-phosphate aldolase [Clostridia bacterium]
MSIASYIDHTLLKPDATGEQIDQLCAEAREYGFASVCVNPYYVARCVKNLKGTDVKVCTVVGFPLGATTAESKVFEALQAIASGAKEIDMVMNVCAMKSGHTKAIEQEIQALAAAVEGQAILKVIIETCLLTDEEKNQACRIARRSGADFVKTSTGFSTGGATVEDIALMRKAVGAKLGVKASGGIRDYATAKAMIEAGATRIGASAGVAIVKEEQEACK